MRGRGRPDARKGGGTGAVTVLLDLDGTLVDGTFQPYAPKGGEPWIPIRAIPGAKRAIQALRRRGFRVALYSMGDRPSRIRRLQMAGIPLRLFDVLYAVPCKDPATFERATSGLAGPIVMVGDSWKHDVAPALGRADAVIWVQGERIPGVLGTPADVDRYPVTVIRSIADLPRTLDRALAFPYDKDAWAGYWEREYGRAARDASMEQLELPLVHRGVGDPGASASTLALRARSLADQAHALWRDASGLVGGMRALHDLDDAERALSAAADGLEDLAEIERAGA